MSHHLKKWLLQYEVYRLLLFFLNLTFSLFLSNPFAHFSGSVCAAGLVFEPSFHVKRNEFQVELEKAALTSEAAYGCIIYFVGDLNII